MQSGPQDEVVSLELPVPPAWKKLVKSAIPFTVDPEHPPPEKDYDVYFKTLKSGITGKELLEQSPVPV